MRKHANVTAQLPALRLSFDDGPARYGALTSILGTLKERRIVAEFDLLGSEVAANPDSARLIIAQGHTVQNHSWDHPDLSRASEADVRSQVERTQAAIVAATGRTPTKLRPPYGAGGWPGRIDPEISRVASSLSLEVRNWDVDTQDWKAPAGLGPQKQALVAKQLSSKRGRPALELLLHVLPPTARDLSAFLAGLAKEGYAFTRPPSRGHSSVAAAVRTVHGAVLALIWSLVLWSCSNGSLDEARRSYATHRDYQSLVTLHAELAQGMERDAVIALLGEPDYSPIDGQSYYSSDKVEANPDPDYPDAVVGLVVEYRDAAGEDTGRLQSFELRAIGE
jgi:peptidoglycan/xylan/chitin deacetylase (PgdA/CDA1 family)